MYPANPFDVYLNRADVKAALHVAPEFVYAEGNNTVEEYLLNDWMQVSLQLAASRRYCTRVCVQLSSF